MRVLKTGLIASVQDLGRPHWQAYGVPSGGAADTLSHRLANFLLGNPAAAATIETAGGFSIRSEEDTWLGFAGPGGQLWVDGTMLPSGGRTMYLPAGSQLDVKPGAGGFFSYLAAPGGWDVPSVMGSASTCLAGGFGGYEGRPLRAQDRLFALQSVEKQLFEKRWVSPWFARPEVFYVLGAPEVIRVMPGPEWDSRSSAEQKKFLQTAWRCSAQRDRMGIRLQGEALSSGSGSTMLSTGVTSGAVQVPPDGQPLVLLADAQTTGGYPRIAQVIAADLPKIAQRPANSMVRFELCDPEEAERLYFVQEKRLEGLRMELSAKAAGLFRW